MKNVRRKQRLVVVSALAVHALWGNPACAQVKLTCPQQFFAGKHDACGSGRMTIHPTGGTTLMSGCLVTTNPPVPAKCILSVVGPPPSKSVRVAFTKFSVNIDAGGPQAKVNNFMIQPVGSPTAKSTYTFTPTQVANTVSMNIGATLHFSATQAVGSYSGTIKLTTNLVP